MTHLFDRTVTILRYDDTITDAFGNARPDWPSDPTTYPGRLRRLSAEEVASAGERGVAEWMLYMAGDVVLTGRDRIEIDSQEYELDGDPYYVHERREVHHLEARLRTYNS